MSVTRWLGFLGVVSVISGLVHYYVWLRLFKQPHWSEETTKIAGWFCVAMALSVPLGPAFMRIFPNRLGTLLTNMVFGWMGLIFIMFAGLVFSELVRLVCSGWLSRRISDLEEPSRRTFLARGIAKAVIMAGIPVSGYALWEGLRPVRYKALNIQLDRCAEALSGFSIVQLTDIHIGPMLGKNFLEQLVDKINKIKPDIVAITGDMVDGSVSELGATIAILKQLKPRYGVFFVTGNHEYYSGAAEWVTYIDSLGIKVLRNERVRITHNGAALDIAGIDDWSAHEFAAGHKADLPKAMAGRDPNIPVVLLAHQPRAVIEAAKLGVDLQLSGHTHGGQIFPFNFLVHLQQPYVSGWHRHGSTQIYVSNGTGFWGPPMRLGIPAELTHITLFPKSLDLDKT